MKTEQYDIVIIGAGPAGLGVAILLQKLGINYIILEKHEVGASFKKWPKETRFISPSFTGNFFKMPDLNAISPDTSPAFNMLTEHPNGQEYAQYLQDASKHFELAVQVDTEVKEVQKKDDIFTIETSKGKYTANTVIWAAGEYQYPKKASFKGDDLCIHYADVDTFADLEGNERIVIGGYESGFDAAINLTKTGKDVTLLDSTDYLHLVNSDSSYCLSPHTRDRIRDAAEGITYYKENRVKEVRKQNDTYIVTTTEDKEFTSKHKPINCTGFDNSLKLVASLFDFKDNYPLLTEVDESEITSNLFLVGPQVKHKKALFCFIYKYRQRFAIVAEHLAKNRNIPEDKIQEILKEYKENNFYLKDLSCCDNECTC